MGARVSPTFRVHCRNWVGVFIATGFLVTLLGCSTSDDKEPPPTPTPPPVESVAPLQYVDGEVCGDCHIDEAELWQGSHHDLAMQEATEDSVLGDFGDRQFRYNGITSTFFRRDGGFWVRTDGPDGQLRDFPIAYTFGVEPLQQYLIEFSDGRIQALSICWDTRPRSQGGQRWFHLYPDEGVDSDDSLHWTGPQQNWNFMCAECHSTHLQKNFDGVENRFGTSWSEIDVSCQACHGPASGHLTWLEEENEVPHFGFPVSLRRDVNWVFATGEVIAQQEIKTGNQIELNVCAQCHSRRGAITDQRVQGQSLLQSHRPALLEEDLYFADGQIKDEVYVWGSFLQSKMSQAGVTCTDCHNSHSLEVFGGADQVCLICHSSAIFDSSEHHFHSAGSPGARCVNCHMPARTYMQVDDRRDHSFRVPRPDLSLTVGTPNACNSCHDDESPAWAVTRLEEWYGEWSPGPHYGEALHAGRTGAVGASAALAALASDLEQPPIVRATALTQLGPPLGTEQQAALRTGFADSSPLVRWGALRAVQAMPFEARLPLVAPLLADPTRLVREQAALALAAVPSSRLRSDQQNALGRALSEYRTSQLFSADRPESYFNLGVLAYQRARFEESERHYQKALEIDARFIPALVNLVDLYKEQQREEEGERLLRLGLSLSPESAELHFGLGLLLIRTGLPHLGLSRLRRAAELQPQVARYSYTYAVALESAGRRAEALDLLRSSILHVPNSRELLMALVTMSRDAGSLDEARQFLDRLITLEPEDSQLRALRRQLESR